jgi:capsular polysaccharide biosynthesis protein
LQYLLPNTIPDFVIGWLDLLGITSQQLVFYDPLRESISCDELLVPTIQHNGCRVSPLLRWSAVYLRNLVAERHTLDQSPYGERIFLSRAHCGLSRRLLNRERVEDMAKEAGFAIVHPERMPLLDQLKMFGGAKCLMGEYGSALHGSIFAPSGAVVCALRGTLLHPALSNQGSAKSSSSRPVISLARRMPATRREPLRSRKIRWKCACGSFLAVCRCDEGRRGPPLLPKQS